MFVLYWDCPTSLIYGMWSSGFKMCSQYGIFWIPFKNSTSTSLRTTHLLNHCWRPILGKKKNVKKSWTVYATAAKLHALKVLTPWKPSLSWQNILQHQNHLQDILADNIPSAATWFANGKYKMSFAIISSAHSKLPLENIRHTLSK